jgi:hypothetical protein
MSQPSFRAPETPSELLRWLAALDRDPSLLPGLQAAPERTLKGLAERLPAFLEHALLQQDPGEEFSRRAWLRQLDQLASARRACGSLEAGRFPWAQALAGQLAEALERRALAAHQVREALEREEEEELEEIDDEELPETPLDRAWGVLRSLRLLVQRSSWDDPRALDEARQGARALMEVTWMDALREASEALEPGAKEPGEDLVAWVTCALETRLLLEEIAAELLAPELFQDLALVDSTLEAWGPALALLPQEDYDTITQGDPLPEGWVSWREHHLVARESAAHAVLFPWGQAEVARNARLARMLSWSGSQVRVGVLEAERRAQNLPSSTPQLAAAAAPDDTVLLLKHLGATPRAERLDRLDQLFQLLKKQACPWMREDLAQATEALLADPSTAELVPQLRTRLRPEPGNVPLLLVLHGTSFGDLWQLRVRRAGSGDPWEKSGVLQAMARDAIRTAFEAAARCMPHGLPPCPFEDHSIELVGGTFASIDAIDGDSVGLAAALAFVSLWLDTSLPEDLACTGKVRANGALGSVGFVKEKAEALARVTLRPGRLLLAAGSQVELPGTVRPLFATTLEEALNFAHLSPQHTGAQREVYTPWLGSVTDRLERLKVYRHHVQNQMLADYRGKGMDAWLVLGDRIRLLVDSLATFNDRQTRREVEEARADAALAFTHGLDGFSAEQMLQGLAPEQLSPQVRVYVGIVELGRLLDACNDGLHAWEETLPQITLLEQQLAALPESDRYFYEGRVLGTIGRVWLHQHRLTQAIDYLERAVASHDVHLWQEAGRSRIYLATALRKNEAFDEAARTLDEASPLLQRCREQWNAAYAEQTMLFWNYELARLLLELNRPLDAIAALESYLRKARSQGSWPLGGMLRTLAWAAAAAALPEQHKAALEELERLARQDTFLQTLLREASGPFRRDGEVY